MIEYESDCKPINKVEQGSNKVKQGQANALLKEEDEDENHRQEQNKQKVKRQNSIHFWSKLDCFCPTLVRAMDWANALLHHLPPERQQSHRQKN